jgi:DNA-binding MarR family transcriptional regulator
MTSDEEVEDTTTPHCADQIDEVIAFWAQENPDLDVTTVALRMRLRSTAHQLERVLRRELAAEDMEMWEQEMLLSLRRAPNLRRRAGELCRLTHVTSGAITNRLARLEERSWIRREVCPDDRRQVMVTLSPAGKRQADKLISIKSEAEARFFSGVSRETIERLNDDLRELLISVAKQGEVEESTVGA